MSEANQNKTIGLSKLTLQVKTQGNKNFASANVSGKCA